MPSTCVFELNNPNGVYYSGQIVSGQITLNTTSEKNVRSIRIRFVGEAKVHWTESESYRNHEGKQRTRSVDYRGREVYVDNATIVHGEGTLPPGTYTYTFNIPLPVACPTSIEGKYGHIRYALWLTLDRPFRFDNEYSRAITVLRTVDLNLNPAYKIPLQSEEISSIGCWPCSSGNILYNLTVPFGAYAPGQTLRYSLHVQNQSMTDITGYSVEFVETLTFTAHTPHHKSRERETILENDEYDDTCLRQMNRLFEGEIELPSMPPTTEGHCIVRVEYYLNLEITIDGCHSNNSISVPIIIGNVPIRESLPGAVATAPPVMPMPQPITTFDGMNPSAPLLPPTANGNDLPPSYGELKPPSFEEAVRSESPFVDPDANEYNRIIGFRPMYPMYPGSSEKQ